MCSYFSHFTSTAGACGSHEASLAGAHATINVDNESGLNRSPSPTGCASRS